MRFLVRENMHTVCMQEPLFAIVCKQEVAVEVVWQLVWLPQMVPP